MQYMAVHSWRVGDMSKEDWLKGAKKIVDDVKSGKLPVKLHGSWLAFDLGLAWCVWEAENLKVLEDYFATDEFRGFRTEMKPIEQVYP